MSTHVRTGTCHGCGATFTLSEAAKHVCQDEHVASTGRCEDYPCCGHRSGECRDRAEYTAAYWQEMHDRLGPERYEEYLERLSEYEAMYG